MTTTPILCGMIGGGTVGGGVYDIISSRINTLPHLKRPIHITKICVRDIDKARDFEIDPIITSFTTDVEDILSDESITLIVEVMGGVGLAKDVVLRSLRSGKSVVTANKALIAECLEEIEGACHEGVRFGYEAAVCGGIPIIKVLQDCYAGDVIHELMGICNGTTNYMLSKMESDQASYSSVLQEAQDLGYAEADPTADVGGFDARSKLAILCKLAFGIAVPPESIPTMGITQISDVDFEYAKLLGCTIKLIGTAGRCDKFGERDGALSVYVAPKMIPTSHSLASARGGGNAIAVQSANMGLASYTGPGAGRFPTANSVVADMYRIVTGCQNAMPFSRTVEAGTLEVDNDYTSSFYIRISFRDGLGIVRVVGELAEKHGVSVNSILQNPIADKTNANFVVTTEECRLSQIEGLVDDVQREDFVLCRPLFMPLLSE